MRPNIRHSSRPVNRARNTRRVNDYREWHLPGTRPSTEAEHRRRRELDHLPRISHTLVKHFYFFSPVLSLELARIRPGKNAPILLEYFFTSRNQQSQIEKSPRIEVKSDLRSVRWRTTSERKKLIKNRFREQTRFSIVSRTGGNESELTIAVSEAFDNAMARIPKGIITDSFAINVHRDNAPRYRHLSIHNRDDARLDGCCRSRNDLHVQT